MEFRQLGKSGLQVPVLCLGTGTFGGGTEFFQTWGSTDVAEARELIDTCMDAGVNFFDTADVYSQGLSEEVLGEAIKHLPREDVLLSTKASIGFDGRHAQNAEEASSRRALPNAANSVGSSRLHLVRQVEGSLKRLKTDYLDVYHMHIFDALTPVEEVLHTLGTLVAAGKIRYIACSNFSGWQLQRSLDVSDRYGWPRYVAQQVYYSLVGRDYEWELMPLGLAEGVGALVWSPLGWGRLTGKIRRGQPPAKGSRLGEGGDAGGPVVEDELLYRVVEALDKLALETGKTVPQLALNWLLQKPTVSSLVIGARNKEQLQANLGAADFALTREQVLLLDAASERPVSYPYWHQRQFQNRNPLPPAVRS